MSLANPPYGIGRASRLSGPLLQMTKCIHFLPKMGNRNACTTREVVHYDRGPVI